MTAELAEAPVEQREVHRLVGGDADPVVDERPRKFAAKTPNQIDREVDRDEFDMRERMEQRDAAALGPALAAIGHPVRRHQLGFGGPRRPVGHHRVAERGTAAGRDRGREYGSISVVAVSLNKNKNKNEKK